MTYINSDTLKIRYASVSDKNAVMLFTRDTWEHGDYIHHVWSSWLKDKNGKLLLGFILDKPVALARVVMLSQDEAWIEGTRVDPLYRNNGYASAIIEQALETAVKMGANIIRFSTSSKNLAIRRIASKLGFDLSFGLHTFRASPVDKKTTRLKIAKFNDFPELDSLFTHSALYLTLKGVYGTGWQYLTFSNQEMKNSLYSQKTLHISAPRTGRFTGSAIIQEIPWDHTLFISCLGGDDQGIYETLCELRILASLKKMNSVFIRFPLCCSLISPVKDAGYLPTDIDPFCVFEKRLS